MRLKFATDSEYTKLRVAMFNISLRKNKCKTTVGREVFMICSASREIRAQHGIEAIGAPLIYISTSLKVDCLNNFLGGLLFLPVQDIPLRISVHYSILIQLCACELKNFYEVHIFHKMQQQKNITEWSICNRHSETPFSRIGETSMIILLNAYTRRV